MEKLKRLIALIICSSAVVAFTAPAGASPITYILQEAEFAGPPTTPVTGMFDFDSMTSTFSNISITTSLATYTELHPHLASNSRNLSLISGTTTPLTDQFLLQFTDEPTLDNVFTGI